MVNRFIILLILFSCISEISAQININFDRDCSNYNTAILSKMLIEAKGEKIVSDLLDKNISFILFCSVDSSGYFVKIEKIREIHGKKDVLVEVENTINSYFKELHIPFYICYEKIPGKEEYEAYDLITSNFYKKGKKCHSINIGFPGDLMSLYQYEQEKAKKEGIVLTKYVYLISQIDKCMMLMAR